MKNLYNNIKYQSRFGMVVISYLMACGLIFSACQEAEIESVPVIDRSAVLSVSASEVQLIQRQSYDEAVTFSWSPGSNMGTGARINYTLQLAAAGSDFSDPLELDMGSNVYDNSFNVADMNTLVMSEFGFIPDKGQTLQARLKTVVKDDSVEPTLSNVIDLTLRPFEPVTTTLFLVGDATPNGWSEDDATPLAVSATDPTVFIAEVKLVPGTFKFITNLGELLPSYNKGSGSFDLVYRESDGQADDQFVVTEIGLYLIEVDLTDLQISMEVQVGPTFKDLYMVGDASPSGWEINTPEAFTQSASDPFVFSYEGLFAEGDFKILAGATGDWCGQWYRPLVNEQDLTLADVEQNSGCDVDNVWQVSAEEAGFYKVTLDQSKPSFSMEKVDLYIVGDGGPNGWNISTPTPMTRSGSVYTYSGSLTEGEFKISKFKGDWCDGEWINAANANQDISNTNFITTQGCDGPDNKWKVTAPKAGNYIVSIDLSAGTMSITPN